MGLGGIQVGVIGPCFCFVGCVISEVWGLGCMLLVAYICLATGCLIMGMLLRYVFGSGIGLDITITYCGQNILDGD